MNALADASKTKPNKPNQTQFQNGHLCCSAERCSGQACSGQVRINPLRTGDNLLFWLAVVRAGGFVGFPDGNTMQFGAAELTNEAVPGERGYIFNSRI